MTITLQIRFDAADIHDAEVQSATTSGGLTNGTMAIGAANSAI
jgi:hypothetical protein